MNVLGMTRHIFYFVLVRTTVPLRHTYDGVFVVRTVARTYRE